MGEFVARNMLGWFKKINKRKRCFILLVAYIVLGKDMGFCDQHRNRHFKVQRNADQQHYCIQMNVKFQYTAGEILANWSLFLFSRNMGKKPDMLPSGITNASIFELLYFGYLSIWLASSRLLPYSLPPSLSVSSSLYRKARMKSPSTFRCVLLYQEPTQMSGQNYGPQFSDT